MKDIIIIHKSLGLGGVETSLRYFLKSVSQYANAEVITWQKDQDDILNKELFSEKLDKIYELMSVSRSKFSELNFKDKIKFLYYKVLTKLNLIEKVINKVIKKTHKEYCADIGVCFAPWKYSLEIYKQKFKCKKNICIVHGDVSRYKCVPDAEENLKYFDIILCVSRSCAETFSRIYPQFADKVDYLYNFQDVDGIIEQSKEEIKEQYKEGFNIVSVSRLGEEKAFLRSLEVFKKLHDNGYNFTWNIVGDGEERQKIEAFIKSNNMSEYVLLYGAKKNPYPYIRKADLLYLGSYHEAAPMVFAEAMILGTPVATTNTCSAKELVSNNGFICENDKESIYEMFKKIFDNHTLLEGKSKILKNYKFKNSEIEKKLRKIINNE